MEQWEESSPSVGGVSWSKSNLFNSIAKKNVWGIIFAGSVVSFVAYRDEPEVIEVDYLATQKKLQGCGYMSIIFSYLAGLSVLNSKPIWLEVSANNNRAIKFYEKFGFICSGSRKNYYKNGQAALNYSYNP